MSHENDRLNMVKRFIEEEGIISHQIDSFNNLVFSGIQKIIDETPRIVMKDDKETYTVTFGEVHIDKPHIIEENRSIKYVTPSECRVRDLFYEGQVSVDIIETFSNDSNVIKENVHRKYPIAKLPVMIGSSLCNLYGKSREEWIESGECDYDKGGYFIIRGKERALISQERINYNTIYVFPSNSGKWKYVAEIRSMSDETGHSVLIKCMIDYKGKVSFSLPYIGEDVEASIIFNAMGFQGESVVGILGLEPELEEFTRSLTRLTKQFRDQTECLTYIGSKSLQIIPKERRIAYAEQIIDNELFPHMGMCSRYEKAILLAKMIRKLVHTFVGKRPEDDRDNISLKRVDTAGALIYDLFRMLFKRLVENVKKYLEKRHDVITFISRLNSITTGLHHSFSTGNWGIKKNTYIKTGVSQVISRLSYSAFISHLRRVVINIGKDGKDTKIRQLHPSQAYFICPAETPEGATVGIVKNLAMTTKISTDANVHVLKDVVIKHLDILRSNDVKNVSSLTGVFTNGILCGFTNNPIAFMKKFKKFRASGVIDPHTSIQFDDVDNEILIFSDQGRLVRPLLTLDDNGKLLYESDPEFKSLSWSELVERGYITYCDNNEIENSVIATTPEELEEGGYDYCEIHPSVMLGVCASLIPFPDHSQAPRNCYSSSMSKQALSSFATNINKRVDTVVHTMNYLQKPLVKTHYADDMGFNDLPSGVNAIVAVATYTGFNQEDSIIINKKSLDMGMFTTTSLKTLVCEEKKKSYTSYETIEVPTLDLQVKGKNYNKLEDDGIIARGVRVRKDDVLVGKIYVKVDKDGTEEKTDCSLIVKKGEEGIIDDVIMTTSLEGNRIVKIKIRNSRRPEIGDKFASREGQKGTCGMIFPPEDMPYTADGIQPDIIINSHAFPSRMTINMLLEMLLGKVGSLEGKCHFSTPFTEHSDNPVDDISERLHTLGFQKHGNEVLYNGFTGEQMEAQIFMGVNYYQRLKHMVGDKMHARNFGTVTMMSRRSEVASVSMEKILASRRPSGNTFKLRENPKIDFRPRPA